MQVGDGDDRCTTYSDIYGRPPAWGVGGDDAGSINTDHIMCCLPHPLGNEYEAPKLPTPPTLKQEAELTLAEKHVHSTYNPFWFSRSDGWQGTTYDDARAFCAGIPDNFGAPRGLCPVEAYCPNGGSGVFSERPLTYRMEPFGETQLSPISNTHDGWIMVGTGPTCRIFQKKQLSDPGLGLDESQIELKKHILCCHSDGGDGGGQNSQLLPFTVEPESANEIVHVLRDEAVSQSSILGKPIPTDGSTGQIILVPSDSKEDVSHTSADNSSPHLEDIDGMKQMLNPLWYDSESGWTGGTYHDAIDFCELKHQRLCPYGACECMNSRSCHVMNQ